MTPTLTALVELGRELRLRPAKPADREVRLGDLYLDASARADLYRALLAMAMLDEDETGIDHFGDEASYLEDCGAAARMAWDSWLQTQPLELVG